MPLRVANKNRTHPIEVCDTIFHIISLTVSEKAKLIEDLQRMDTVAASAKSQDEAFGKFLDILVGAIVKIDGFENQPVREVLSNLEDMTQLLEITKAVINHCSLTFQEAKNSLSSPVQPIPDSVRGVEIDAVLDGAVASTTQTKTD